MSVKQIIEEISLQKLKEGLLASANKMKSINFIEEANEESENDVDIIYDGPEGQIYFPKTKNALKKLTENKRFFMDHLIDFENIEDTGYYILKTNNNLYKINFKSGYFANHTKYIIVDKNFSKIDNGNLQFLFDKIFVDLTLDEKVKFFHSFHYKYFFVCFNTIPCHKFNKKYMKKMLEEYKRSPKQNQKDLLYSWLVGKKSKYPDNLTENDFIEHIYFSHNPIIWNFVDKKYIKSEYFLKYLPEKNKLFSIMSDKFKTQEVCDLAISKCKGSLYFVPKKYKTPELCQKAVLESSFNIQFVPKKLITEEICKHVFESGIGYWKYLGYFKQYKKDFIELFEKDSKHLEYLPPKMRTLKRCELALRHNPIMKRHIPEKIYKQIQERKKRFDTYEICVEKIKTGELFINEVPEHLITQKLCDLAIETRYFYFSRIPRKFMSQDMCRKILKTSGYLLQSVPKDMRTEELCLLAYNAKHPAWASIPMWIREKHNLKPKPGCP